MKRLLKTLWAHFFSPSYYEDFAYWTLYEESAQEYEDQEPQTALNENGLRLKYFLDRYFVGPYWLVRRHFCKHEEMECDDWAGPDSGGESCYCPTCGFSFHHTMY